MVNDESLAECQSDADNDADYIDNYNNFDGDVDCSDENCDDDGNNNPMLIMTVECILKMEILNIMEI